MQREASFRRGGVEAEEAARRKVDQHPFVADRFDGELVAAIGANRKMVIFGIDQVPEMTRGRGVRLQKYKEKGLSDVTTFKADEGLTWTDSAGRTQSLSMKDLKDWRGKRADAGRIAQGLPKNNKFRATPTSGKSGDEE